MIPGATSSSFPELLGECPALRTVHAQIGRALDVPLPVLIEGETGTGKDLAAWLIHDRGPRRAGPYVTLNCAAMNDSLLELELFGHRRGAFVGADRDRPGLFGAARGGTLFLDEVAELSSSAQCKLLRAVESGEVLPVGAERVEHSDARIIAASSASLEEAVRAGKFRRDLYYRLRVLTLRLPPLRDWREDIPLLAERLLEAVCQRLSVPPHRLSREVVDAFVAAAWPGNVRQLIHELERAVVTSDGLEIELGHLSAELQAPLRQRAVVGGRTDRSMDLARSPESSPGTGPQTPSSQPAPADAAVDALLRKLAGLDAVGVPSSRLASPSIRGYRLRERIAEGGMGEVWRAEQQEPVRREVAVKLIKAGMDSRRVMGRFEAERQALALMDHPAIAKVLDGGVTEQGQPFFAMEYVRGVPIDQHCDQAQLSLPARIALFRQVCAGVEHAHHKAILHRDLKPANVLVTFADGEAQVKIIDFGVAKALAQPLTERALQTEVGQTVGTLAYMSPEQAHLTQQDVDARTDVYALGVMLYQLLAGSLPFSSAELLGLPREELSRRLCETDPPRPSERLMTATEERVAIARRRASEPSLLRRELAGDLDAIVMKALERDRSRRYGSAAELSADLLRYLEQQPVLARRPGVSSWLSRLVRRHRLGIASAAGVMLVVLQLGFSVSMALHLRRDLHPPATSAFTEDVARQRQRSTRLLADGVVDTSAPHVLR
ncbi:MAG TPA: sigma 54-interacting transcriptional regulator [Myxococcaceae bacterium]|nr:sigma 54-interacting transcriptional regulator [Myxococcaceae bacterium]